MANELRKERKVVAFSSTKSVDVLADGMLKAGCGEGTVTASGMMPSGSGGYVSTSSAMQFTLDQGREPDGSRWLALRADGMIHMLSFGIVLHPRSDGGTDAQALVADARKVETIKSYAESGSLFCYWRTLSYPYD